MSANNKTVRVATDVGGTFTDLVYFEVDHDTNTQTIRTAKVDTTPPNFEQGVLNVLAKGDVSLDAVDSLVHGSTVVINALTERRGVKTALITTKGFRDVLQIARGNRPDFFNLNWVKGEPYVPRHLSAEVPGRVTATGIEREPLDLAELPTIVEFFRAEGVQSIAICLLHSYANPAHEMEVVETVKSLWPEVSLVASHQITREWREYERASTTALSAYVQPIVSKYLNNLEAGLADGGYRKPLYVMKSNCGIDSVNTAKQVPIEMVESGPASGFWGAAELGQLIGEPNVLGLDIGGTTAKCSLVKDGEVSIKTDYWIERDRTHAGYPIMVPVVDLIEIGNGGGSIAWIDELNKLNVGPQSAGASPGPAAYGRGGTGITTTDANLILNRINPDYFCGGSINADMAAVDRAVAPLMQKLGMTAVEVARGIIRLANNNMVNALKLVSLSRGHDPRDFTLVGFGGGGALHAVALGQELGVKKVVIPKGASVFSAWGMIMSNLRRDFFLNKVVQPTDLSALMAAEELVREMSQSATQQYESEGIVAAKVKLSTSIKTRYQNQGHSVELVLLDDDCLSRNWSEIAERFHAEYERQFTYRLDSPIEIVGLHVTALGDIGRLQPQKLPVTGRVVSDALKAKRVVDYALDGIHEASIYNADCLEPGMEFNGPAVIEDEGTTVVIHPGNHVKVDQYGNFHIHL